MTITVTVIVTSSLLPPSRTPSCIPSDDLFFSLSYIRNIYLITVIPPTPYLSEPPSHSQSISPLPSSLSPLTVTHPHPHPHSYPHPYPHLSEPAVSNLRARGLQMYPLSTDFGAEVAVADSKGLPDDASLVDV